ncbi:hypothetical protein FQR65_LT14827 [Abscondita terminalis]|nr:hypothetical protein FQR65_LT14827 [Abscondita terminalis]
MKFLKVITFALIYHKVSLKEIKCPSHCDCDIFENFRRASCQKRSLISIEADIPSEAQILDLSYNFIYNLQDHIFAELQLTDLLLLNVSHNRINAIHINVFFEMDKLKTLDLSYNNIEYVLKHWFWNTPSLQELYLRGNNLRKLNEPIAESSTIRILDISSCSLLYIHESAFNNLPELYTLDLSENYLTQLRVDIIKPCPNLNVINIENNNLSCNNHLENLIEYCRDTGIRIADPCDKKKLKKPNEFERIIAIVEERGRNSWIYEGVVTEISSPTDCNCNQIQTSKGSIYDDYKILPIFLSLLAFFAGLVLGIIIRCNYRSNKTVKRRKSKMRRARPMSDIYIALTDAFEVSETTPMPTRREIMR